jgi:hypothetical protein
MESDHCQAVPVDDRWGRNVKRIESGTGIIKIQDAAENPIYLCQSCAYDFMREIQGTLGAFEIAKGITRLDND